MDNKEINNTQTDKTEKKQYCEKKLTANFQTNPIVQKMHNCNEAAKKMKFKIKDLFR